MLKYVSVALGPRDELIAELTDRGGYYVMRGKDEHAAHVAWAIQQLKNGQSQVKHRHTTYVVYETEPVSVVLPSPDA